MLTLMHRPVRLPDGKIIHRNISSKNRSQYWIRYQNDWYQVRPDDRTVDVEHTGFPFILMSDTPEVEEDFNDRSPDNEVSFDGGYTWHTIDN